MSRPRFLADNDLNDAIVLGTNRREAAIEFVRIRDFGMQAAKDDEVLRFAAANRFIVVSHDVNSLTAEAHAALGANKLLSGLFLVHQRDPTSSIIDSLVLIWSASEAEEWIGQIVFLPL